jgi:hypothetical protein
MRRLTDRRGGERGAVAAIVAIIFGAFVLTGVAALTVDAGSLYAERRVVQNGADAASLALAQACARGDVAKCSASWSDLTSLADLNSPDGFTDIASVCGSGAPFASCVFPASPALKDCINLPASLPSTANWVEVRTKTRSTTANPSVVSRFFANLSDPSYQGSGVRACARAAWGPAGALQTVVPLTFSICEWYAATANGTIYGNRPPFTASNPETPAREIALALTPPMTQRARRGQVTTSRVGSAGSATALSAAHLPRRPVLLPSMGTAGSTWTPVSAPETTAVGR